MQMDQDGRKYLRWTTLLGLEKKDDTAATARRVAFWLHGASLVDLRSCQYMGYDPLTMEHRIQVEPGNTNCSFVLKPTAKAQTIVRPLIRVEGWGEHIPEVRLTGVPLRAGEDMEAAIEDGNLIIWINREIKGPTKVMLVGN